MSALAPERILQFALAHHQAGRLAEAESLYLQLLVLQPACPDALHLLGTVKGQRGCLDEARKLIDQAIARAPNNPVYHFNLGTLMLSQARWKEAALYLRQALALKADDPKIYNNLGNALRHQGLFNEALDCFNQALALHPSYPEAHNNIGNVQKDLGQFDLAVSAYQKALVLNPNYADAHNNLGNAFENKNQPDEAIASYQKALSLSPNLAAAHNNLGNIWKAKGQLDQAITAYRRALTGNPDFTAAHDNLLVTLHYHPSVDLQSLLAEHQRWNKQHAPSLCPPVHPHHHTPDPTRRLRIGYISPDLREHPVGRFLMPLLRQHDHAAFHVSCYPSLPVFDDMTKQLKAYSHNWRSIVGLTSREAADVIRHDEVDILIDLAMHSANNNLAVLAHKPAPVQITYLAYAGGTALDTIDYRLTDRYLNPDPAEDQYYIEKSYRLDSTYWCYEPLSGAPPVSPLPALVVKNITFGCLNSFSKITTPTLKTWATLLQRLPHARLLLHARPGTHRNTLKQFFQQRGIDPDRIELLSQLSITDYFKAYDRIDIAIDPFPYNGGTTTCDALWMGVPVITLAGHAPVARAGVSILSNSALSELIAFTPEQYIQLAANLANDLPRLASLRASMRLRLQSSPLMDAPRFARTIEQAYRIMWRAWCTNQLPCNASNS